MAAVTGAMADAKITGFIDGAYKTNKATTSANATTSTSSVGNGANNGQSQITISSSEDLGGGLKAFGALRINPSPFSAGAGGTTNLAQDVSEIGISGPFGTVLLNRDYGIDFGVHGAADASGWTSGEKGVIHNTSSGLGNGVVYVLPEFVPGLGVLVAKGVAGTAGGDGNATAYRLTYNTGGLMVQYAAATVNYIAAGTAATDGTGTGWSKNYTTGQASTTAATEVTAANRKAGVTALAVTYDLGMVKLHFGKFSAKSGGDADQKSSSDMIGVSVPFGATTFGITSSSAKKSLADGTTTVKASGYRGKVSYALSKRTTVYGAYGAEKVSNTTQADKQTTFGLAHSF
jgi:predicted porin